MERFHRADPSRSPAHGGSGLGLSIAAVIAKGHGGRLELDTAPGTRVHVPPRPPCAASERTARWHVPLMTAAVAAPR
ncbi:ATP-binding protein [Streptomyces canus]|uniref:ATP-binding protein n=1 Tax=Streptomyces canus TaxID=58343 RepID=UPI00367F17E9